jgi:hypothetical protein
MAATWALLCATTAFVLLPTDAARASLACYSTFPADNLYFLEVMVEKRVRISCSAGFKVGRSLWRAYEHGLPARDYPPPPHGVPGGGGQTFHLSTAAGGFTCRMLSRGSDFVLARCRRGQAMVRIYDHRDCCASARDDPTSSDQRTQHSR